MPRLMLCKEPGCNQAHGDKGQRYCPAHRAESALARPCEHPGCAELLKAQGQRYCAEHKIEHEPHRHNVHESERLGFYRTQRWQDLRARKLMRDPLCQICNRAPAKVVHHVKPARLHPELIWSMSNLQSACRVCHDRSRQAERFIGEGNSDV